MHSGPVKLKMKFINIILGLRPEALNANDIEDQCHGRWGGESTLCREKWDREQGTIGFRESSKSPDLLYRVLDLRWFQEYW